MSAAEEARVRLVALGVIPADEELGGPETGPETPDEGRLVVEDGLPVCYFRHLPERTLRDSLPFLVAS